MLQVSVNNHPKKGIKTINYGTAGFRTKSSDLDHVMFRMGLLAVLRAKAKHATIGVMITASHNPEEDNGVKLVDPMGEMLHVSWEQYATKLANVSDAEISACLTEIAATENIDMTSPAAVTIAQDTRASSVALSQAIADGVKTLDAQLTDYGLLTTPQLHYMVRCINTQNDYGLPTEEGYYKKLSQAFSKLHKKSSGNYKCDVCIDGANGVGAVKMKRFLPYLDSALNVTIVNDGTTGKLNYMCGADHVKVQQQAPEGIQLKPGVRCCSFDGDADRIVYFYEDVAGTFRLLDGDKIATLIAGYLQDLVAASCVKLNLGLVQTAYANGSSTRYITEELKVPVACTATGVKHLHHRAQQFDVGVYFEANGHGTVLFSDEALDKIRSAKSSHSLSSSQQEALHALLLTVDVINQTVGDAISDMLLVEIILSRRGWSEEEWNQSYSDLPNRQLKIKVKDRRVIETTDAERRTTSPPGLQSAIDDTVSKYTTARAFARPSGTEDVVRVYAEANTQANAELLAYDVSCLVYEQAGGVGEPPKQPQ